jgi:sugar phosphate isomerase/epimerase
MDRRAWLLRALAGTGALTVGGVLGSCASGTGEAEEDAPTGGADGALVPGPLGVQLYTVRTLLDDDVPGTLQAVADVGYTEVELAGLHGLTAERMREHLDAAGLSAPSSHIPVERLRADLEGAIEEALALGHRTMVVPSPGADDHGQDGYRRLAEDLDRFGERARDAGLMVGFHNHDGELRDLGGRRGWDILLRETDPALVTMQMDVYWTVHGGGDPMTYMREHPGRFRSIHAKGRDAAGEMVAVGGGTIDWPTLLPALRADALEHVFVEHDRPADPIANIRASYAYLRGRDG